MTDTLNILDFDDNGRAVILIPQIQDNYSFVLNHWRDVGCQLEEIEDDLSCSDTEERRGFLEKVRRLLLEYREQLEDGGDEEHDEICNIETLKEVGCDEKDIENFEFEKDEIDEEKLKLSNTNIYLDVEYDSEREEAYLCVHHFRLQHSLAWYIMNRLDREITMIEEQTEKLSGLLKIYDSNDNYDKAITIIRKSNCLLMARSGLMAEFQLSENQAEFILSMKFRDFTCALPGKILQHLEFYTTVKSFLNRLKD